MSTFLAQERSVNGLCILTCTMDLHVSFFKCFIEELKGQTEDYLHNGLVVSIWAGLFPRLKATA